MLDRHHEAHDRAAGMARGGGKWWRCSWTQATHKEEGGGEKPIGRAQMSATGERERRRQGRKAQHSRESVFRQRRQGRASLLGRLGEAVACEGKVNQRG
jgi:hypothetical protein